jgi:hypothetical protein
MGYANMLNQNRLINQWKKWINRNKTFNKDDIHELETHLIDEMEYLTEKEGLSEQEAFYKAVDIIGEREELNEEFDKVKPLSARFIQWIKSNSLQLMTCLCLILFITGFILGWYPTYREITNLKEQMGYVQTFKGPFVPFKTTKNKLPEGINKPKIAWKNELRYNKEIPEYVNHLINDGEGNIYFIADYKNKSILYCISPDGKTKWMNDNLKSGEIIPANNGIIMNTWIKGGKLRIAYYDKNGQYRWSQKGSFSSIGPDGMVYAYIIDNNEFYSCDSNGKIRWLFRLPQKGEYIDLIEYFFDNISNIHIVVAESDKAILYTFSSNGKYINKKELWINSNYDIQPFKDSKYNFYSSTYNNYFLAFSNEETYKIIDDISKKNTAKSNNIFNVTMNYCCDQFSEITSFTSDGYVKYIFKKSQEYFDRLYDCKFGSNSNFYIVYSRGLKENSDMASSQYKGKRENSTYLESISEDGNMLFKNEIKSSYNDLLIDKENYLYIASGGFLNFEGTYKDYIEYEKQYKKKYSYEEIQKGLKDKRTIYCYYPDGKLKWQMEQPNPQWSYNSGLVFGPNHSLYYIESGTNTLYCIQDESNK